MGEPFPGTPPAEIARRDRLESWKEIAAYLRRDVTTVQRWEKREGMPVHRHLHDRVGSVYASRAELDEWVQGRNPPAEPESENGAVAAAPPAPPLRAISLVRVPMEIRVAAGRGGLAGGRRLHLAAEDGIPLVKSDHRRTLSDGHGLR